MNLRVNITGFQGDGKIRLDLEEVDENGQVLAYWGESGWLAPGEAVTFRDGASVTTGRPSALTTLRRWFDGRRY